MYSDGAFGIGNEPSANLIAISHEPATDRYSSDDGAVSTSCALKLSLSSAATAKRNTLVSSRYFMPFSWFFSRAFSLALRKDQAGHRREARQNPREWLTLRGECPTPVATSREAREHGARQRRRDCRDAFPR